MNVRSLNEESLGAYFNSRRSLEAVLHEGRIRDDTPHENRKSEKRVVKTHRRVGGLRILEPFHLSHPLLCPSWWLDKGGFVLGTRSSPRSSAMTEVLPVETSDHWYALIPCNFPPCANPVSRKSAGNDFYKVKNYPGAVTAYGKAIDLDPSNALLFTNRAAAHLMLMQYREASVDCDAAIKLDQTCSKAYFRKATALKGLGRLEPAIDALNKGLEHDPSSSTAFQEKASLVGAKDKMAAIRALLKRKSYTAALVQVSPPPC